MGYYIQGPALGKANHIVGSYGGQLSRPIKPSELPPGKALICVVNNFHFEAAGFCYDDREFEAFNDPDDLRPKTWVIMDLEKAKELTGYGDNNWD